MKIHITNQDVERNPGILDWALRTARTPGDVIELGSGVKATTAGAWSFTGFGFIGLADGVSLVATLENATIGFAQNALGHVNGVATKEIHILWIGKNTLVQGIKFDCASSPEINRYRCGIRAFGVFTVKNCTITGLIGSRKDGIEAFAISAEGETGGSLVEGVRVKECASDGQDSYVSGIYMGATKDNGVANRVTRCSVDLLPMGQFAVSSTYMTDFQHCNLNASRVWYTDTSTGVAVLRNCSGKASYAIISSVAPSGTHQREIAAIDCVFTTESGRAAEWWDNGGRNDGFIAFKNCDLRAKTLVSSAATSGSIAFFGCDVTECGDSVIQPGSPKPIIM